MRHDCQLCDRPRGIYDLWRDVCGQCENMLGDMKPGVEQAFRHLLERLRDVKVEVADLRSRQHESKK